MGESRKLRLGYHDNVAFLFDFVIKEFWPVGVQGPSDRKKGLTTLFFVLYLFYRGSLICYKENYIFQGSRGVQHFTG